MKKKSNKWAEENLTGDIADFIFRIKIPVPNQNPIERDFSADVNVDYEMLEEQLAEIPSQYAFWSTLLSEQKFTVAKIERMIARRRSAISENAIEVAKGQDSKLTKYMLDELVEADDKMLELQTQLVSAERTLSKLFGLVEAMKMKSDSLRSLAGFKKEEMREH